MPHSPSVATLAEAGRSPFRVTVLSLFPELFPGPLSASLTGQALAAGLWSLRTIALREFGRGRHRTVDDTPAGGGAGMVLRADVLAAAIDHARLADPDLPLVYLSPRGAPFDQAMARRFAAGPGLMLLAGRFEGIDERVIAGRAMTEVSIGDFVLSGGEIAAMAMADACLRLVPGVIGAAESLMSESFEDGLLEYPQYTRPRSWEGRDIPPVLLSGDHATIARWRRAEAERLTAERRPDLLAQAPPSTRSTDARKPRGEGRDG
jgi:tRNA (guanine37-N1)-methyltransferase